MIWGLFASLRWFAHFSIFHDFMISKLEFVFVWQLLPTIHEVFILASGVNAALEWTRIIQKKMQKKLIRILIKMKIFIKISKDS